MTTKITDKNISNIANRFIQWQSVITADGSTATSAVAGQGYLIDTTSATHTINLPTSASNGDSIVIKDYAGTFNTNNLTIGRNGHNIQGVANDSSITSNRASVTLVYIDSTKGWVYTKESNVGDLQGPLFTSATGGTIATSGDFKIHTFTGDGCFVVTQLGNAPSNPTGGPSNVDYLVVAGGGAGGWYGAGGGAGGYRTSYPSPAGVTPVTATSYPITVGGGGAINCSSVGDSGTNSVFGTITSAGGGGGGALAGPAPGRQGLSGGSGGGSGARTPGGSGTLAGGAGNTPPVSPPQGNAGGSGPGCSYYGGGAGGGATAVGGNGGPGGGTGGAGAPNSITGSAVTYAGGGGGGAGAVGSPGAGGAGGGGAGGTAAGSLGTAGTVNTGGGGGGGGNNAGFNGGAGGKGIVIIRYKFQ